MSIISIIVIAVIIAMSVVGALMADEPLDTVTEVEAAIGGVGMAPLACKVATGSKASRERTNPARAHSLPQTIAARPSASAATDPHDRANDEKGAASGNGIGAKRPPTPSTPATVRLVS